MKIWPTQVKTTRLWKKKRKHCCHSICQMLRYIKMCCHIMWHHCDHNATKCDNNFCKRKVSGGLLSQQPHICFNLPSLHFEIGKSRDEKLKLTSRDQIYDCQECDFGCNLKNTKWQPPRLGERSIMWQIIIKWIIRQGWAIEVDRLS